MNGINCLDGGILRLLQQCSNQPSL